MEAKIKRAIAKLKTVKCCPEDVKAGRATDWEGFCENDDGQCNQAAAM